MKRRIFFALCTSSPSSFLPKLPTKWRVETSLSSRPCLLPSLRLRNLFTSSFLLAPFTATAGKPRNKSRHRFFPLRTTRSTDKTSRITIFSTGIERRCTLAKVSLRFKHFFTLYPFAEIFFYFEARRHSRQIPNFCNCKGYRFLDRSGDESLRESLSFSFLSPKNIPPKIFPSSVRGRFIPVCRD